MSLPILNPTVADAIFWGAVACCVVAQVAILRTVAEDRDVSAAASQLPKPRRILEAIWTVLPAVALAILLVVTWRRTHPPAEASMRSHVSTTQGRAT